MTLRAISYGGGVQSTALLVLAAQGDIDFPLFLFSNVGSDSEHPATIDYVRKVAQPYARAHGITIEELARIPQKGLSSGPCDGEGHEAIDVLTWSRDGDGVPELEGSCPTCGRRFRFERGDEPVLPAHRRGETLYGRLVQPGSRSLPIPVRMGDTGAPGTRSCTADFKIAVIGRRLKELGASEATPAVVGVGFSTDEFHRANRKRAQPWEIPEYPLLDLGLDRAACAQLIADGGLPVPPKSACYFCPFHRPATWAEMRRDEPELFEKSVQLERLLNERRDGLQCQRAGEPATLRVHDERTDESELEPLPDGEHRCPSCHAQVPVAGGVWGAHSRDHVFFTRFGKPLDEAIAEAQPSLFGADGPEECDEGYCWT